MILKTKFTGMLLLLIALLSVSCSDKEEYLDSITLSYVADGVVFDNQAKLISIPLLSESLPIQINGGDGNYSITNNSTSIINHEYNGQLLVISALSTGSGSITISDNSKNSYILKINVFSNQNSTVKTYTYGHILSDGITKARRTELANKIAANAVTGAWHFQTSSVEEGKEFTARLYFTDDEESEYKEYKCMPKGEIESLHQAAPPAVQVVLWLVMKSDTEKFVLYICQPFVLDSGKLIRGYNLVRNVTDRYITEYPEITGAWEVQSYYNQDY